MIGDCRTAALVGSDGSIDWLCLPRFDSASVFGALLGTEDHGRWRVAPSAEVRGSTRSYVDGTFALVTCWTTPTGEADVIDLMPFGDRHADIIRRVRGISGTVEFADELVIRFDYGEAIPWVRQIPEERGTRALVAIAGPDGIVRRGPPLAAIDQRHRGRFAVSGGETVDITMTWFPSHLPVPALQPTSERIASATLWWTRWSARARPSPVYATHVHRSLLVLRALTHDETGGFVAAATTSLPESFGGSRNWDYRYVWLRDASLTLHVLPDHGFDDEAEPWRRWLLRAIAGDPGDVQIMYGISGERRLVEYEIPSLPGYKGSSPVRAGNGAFQ